MEPTAIVALVVLPERYNPDARGSRGPIKTEQFERTMEEIAARFGGGVLWRFESGPARGFWWDRGALFDDELAVLEVDIPDEPAARQWLVDYCRQTLAPRFNQVAMYIRFVGPIEVEVVRIP